MLGNSFRRLSADQNDNLVTDIKSSLDLWRAHFNAIFNSDDTNNFANEMIKPIRPNTQANTTPPAPPRSVMAFLLNFLKLKEMSWLAACNILLCNIWSLESLPSDWSLSLLCPVLKKGDATICNNYQGISLLTIAYRILSSVLCERMKPFVNKLIGSYQYGFIPANPPQTRFLRYAKA